MLGLIACASACVSLSAFGNTNDDWFAVSVLDATATLTHVSTNMGVEVAGGRLVINTDSEPLAFTPDPLFAGTNRSDGVITIAASVALTPSSLSDFEATIPNAKVGIAVGIDNNDETNYYGYASAGWKLLTGDDVSVPAPGDDTSFALVLDYRTHVAKFYVGEVLMTYNDTTPTNAPAFATGTDTLLNIAASGSGSITSIDTDFEVAVAAYNDIKYGSIAEAVDAAKADSHSATDVQAVDSNGAAQSPSATALNGLNLVVCEAMGLPTDKTTDEATVKLEPATSQNSGKITLAWIKPDAAENGVEIQFKVKNGATEYGPYDWNNIQIPMSPSGTYTIEPSIK